MNIVSIDPDKRSVLVPLFANYLPQRIFINSVLEEHSGIALADSKSAQVSMHLSPAGAWGFEDDAMRIETECIARLLEILKFHQTAPVGCPGVICLQVGCGFEHGINRAKKRW